MAGKSKKAGQRLLVLKHNIWWFRREIPELCREALGRGRFLLVNLRTSDLKRAQAIRDDLEKETAKTFADIRAGVYVGPSALSAREQGIAHREARDVFGKRFARYRLAVGVDDTREGKRRSLTNFHSARRWFATQAARAGQAEAVIKDLLGHEPDEKNVTRRYIAQASALQLRACVEAVRLPRAPEGT